MKPKPNDRKLGNIKWLCNTYLFRECNSSINLKQIKCNVFHFDIPDTLSPSHSNMNNTEELFTQSFAIVRLEKYVGALKKRSQIYPDILQLLEHMV